MNHVKILKLTAARACAIASVLIAVSTVAAYLFNEPRLSSWGTATDMSFPTAIAVALNAAAILIMASAVERHHEQEP